MFKHEDVEMLKQNLDGAAIALVSGHWFGWITLDGAIKVGTLAWVLVRVYESNTCQRLIKWVRSKLKV